MGAELRKQFSFDGSQLVIDAGDLTGVAPHGATPIFFVLLAALHHEAYGFGDLYGALRSV